METKADRAIWTNGDGVPRNKFRKGAEYQVFLLDGSRFFGEFLGKYYHGTAAEYPVIRHRPVSAIFYVTWGPNWGSKFRTLNLQRDIEAIYTTGHEEREAK